MLKLLFIEMLKGKSLLRTLTNQWISTITLYGNGIDLGARNNKSSYFRFIKKNDNVQITFCDLEPQTPEVVKIDLEKKMPFESDTKDFLLLMHVLEHLFEYQNCIDECHRILKPGKPLIGCVPFLYQIHLDPDDNFRYTASSLTKILKKAGFSKVEIFPLGFGPFSTGVSQYAGVFKIKLFVFSITYFSTLIDRILNQFIPNHHRLKPENFPLAYGFIATK
jgi:SAM-dependent methyltransferase